MLNNINNRSLVPANRRYSRALEAHNRDVALQVNSALSEMQGRQTLVEYELDVNAMVVSRAASNEMSVAEHMIARAGMSQVAQSIAADRISRLMQADSRTLSKGGF